MCLKVVWSCRHATRLILFGYCLSVPLDQEELVLDPLNYFRIHHDRETQTSLHWLDTICSLIACHSLTHSLTVHVCVNFTVEERHIGHWLLFSSYCTRSLTDWSAIMTTKLTSEAMCKVEVFSLSSILHWQVKPYRASKHVITCHSLPRLVLDCWHDRLALTCIQSKIPQQNYLWSISALLTTIAIWCFEHSRLQSCHQLLPFHFIPNPYAVKPFPPTIGTCYDLSSIKYTL